MRHHPGATASAWAMNATAAASAPGPVNKYVVYSLPPRVAASVPQSLARPGNTSKMRWASSSVSGVPYVRYRYWMNAPGRQLSLGDDLVGCEHGGQLLGALFRCLPVGSFRGLMRHGYVAAQAPRRYSTFDLFTDKGMQIQVKASRKGCNWLVGQVRPEPALIHRLVDFEVVTPEPCTSCRVRSFGMPMMPTPRRYKEMSPDLRVTSIHQLLDPWRKRYEPAKPFRDGWLHSYREAWDQLGTPEV